MKLQESASTVEKSVAARPSAPKRPKPAEIKSSLGPFLHFVGHVLGM